MADTTPLTLQEITRIARETALTGDLELIAAIPSEGDARYVEMVFETPTSRTASRRRPSNTSCGSHSRVDQGSS